MTTSATIIFSFVSFLLLVFLPTTVISDSGHQSQANQTFRPHQELQRLKRIRAYLRKINKPAIKTIQSPDGDVIDCVLSHLQPAFDHPQLKGQEPLEPPEWPKGHESIDSTTESIQLWTNKTDSCPEGTIPIRRTTEKDVLRASSIWKFGRKIRRRDTMSSDHEAKMGLTEGECTVLTRNCILNPTNIITYTWRPYTKNYNL